MLKRNLIANFLGQGWTALMGLAFLPLYIKYLGIEAYGLIGVYAVLQAWLTLADVGMTPTLNREMARLSAGAHTAQSIGDLMRSLEVLCLGLALGIALIVWSVAAWLARDWLHAQQLPLDQISQAIAIMGAVASLRVVEGLYRGAMLGLQRQVWTSLVGAAVATMRWAGAVGVLVWVSPTIGAFFAWQGMVSLVSVFIFAIAVHRSLPSAQIRPRFSMAALATVGRFASGVSVTAVFALLLTQFDKILLSRLLSLEDFGIYTLAATVAGALSLLVAPIFQAFYPQFTRLITSNDAAGLALAYHRGAELASVLLFPAALVMAMFGEKLLWLWTSNSSLARDSAPLLALLAMGNLLNGLVSIPYALQLAGGWSGYAARVNGIFVALLVPAILWAVPRFGARGAASVWLLLNAGYIVVNIALLHRHILPKEKWRWYGLDVALPGAAAFAVAAVCLQCHPAGLAPRIELVWLLSSGLVILMAAAAAAPELRAYAFRRLRLKQT